MKLVNPQGVVARLDDPREHGFVDPVCGPTILVAIPPHRMSKTEAKMANLASTATVHSSAFGRSRPLVRDTHERSFSTVVELKSSSRLHDDERQRRVHNGEFGQQALNTVPKRASGKEVVAKHSINAPHLDLFVGGGDADGVVLDHANVGGLCAGLVRLHVEGLRRVERVRTVRAPITTNPTESATSAAKGRKRRIVLLHNERLGQLGQHLLG